MKACGGLDTAVLAEQRPEAVAVTVWTAQPDGPSHFERGAGSPVCLAHSEG
jgi:hypothetical protein